MNNYFIKKLFILFLYWTPLFSYAWNPLGHMVIANIAYQHLEPHVQKKVDKIVSYFGLEYPSMASFLQMAYWPDTLRAQKIETFTHWHYIDVPFTDDGSELKNIIDTDNIVWAINNIKPIIKYKYTNSYEQARFLAFLIHIVGDIHQPLHTVSYLSAAYPNGDQGGNLYFIRYNNERIKLHRFWDNGLGTLDQSATLENAEVLTAAITDKYPQAYFGKQVSDLDLNHWVQEGMVNAKGYVYTVSANQTPNNDYLKTGRKIAERQVALAGYRLATLLNYLLS
ncbi:MAG: hypothetical protein A3F42_05250 [Gammaproteobacteria bacterium RIFCSPHIGHO2_12_FULL_37_34]|nr:MAG: hypothetical protein A3F42_05250 [Gammaproteobacteria bacterium RIFCSPHIGHO2_12_FULL_37_34]